MVAVADWAPDLLKRRAACCYRNTKKADSGFKTLKAKPTHLVLSEVDSSGLRD
mgnify:CR=1 FL=1